VWQNQHDGVLCCGYGSGSAVEVSFVGVGVVVCVFVCVCVCVCVRVCVVGSLVTKCERGPQRGYVWPSVNVGAVRVISYQ
jgi:hypothetical protein